MSLLGLGEYKKKFDEVKKSNKPFTDPDFPPNKSSLIKPD
jgi:hypothetical protein